MAQDSDDLSIPPLTAGTGRRRQPIQARGARRVPSFDRGHSFGEPPDMGVDPGEPGEAEVADYRSGRPVSDGGLAVPPGPHPSSSVSYPVPPPAPTSPPPPPFTPAPSPYTKAAGRPVPGLRAAGAPAAGTPPKAPPAAPPAPPSQPVPPSQKAGRSPAPARPPSPSAPTDADGPVRPRRPMDDPLAGRAVSFPPEPEPGPAWAATAVGSTVGEERSAPVGYDERSAVDGTETPREPAPQFGFDGLDPVAGTDRRAAPPPPAKRAMGRPVAASTGDLPEADLRDIPGFDGSASRPGDAPGAHRMSAGDSAPRLEAAPRSTGTPDHAQTDDPAPLREMPRSRRAQMLAAGREEGDSDYDDGSGYGEDAYDPLLDPPPEARTRRPVRRRGRMVALTAIALGLAVAAGGGIWAWQSGIGPADDVPLIRADTAPIRVEPENPGGLEVPHQDRLILNEPVDGTDPAVVQAIQPPPETPVDPLALLAEEAADGSVPASTDGTAAVAPPDRVPPAAAGTEAPVAPQDRTAAVTVEPPVVNRTPRTTVPTGSLTQSGPTPAPAASGTADGVEALLARRPADANDATGPAADPLPLMPGVGTDPLLPDLVTGRPAPADPGAPTRPAGPIGLTALVTPADPTDPAIPPMTESRPLDGTIPGQPLGRVAPGAVTDMRIMLAAPLDLEASDPPFGLTYRMLGPAPTQTAAAPPAPPPPAATEGAGIPSTGLGPPETAPVPPGGRVLAQPDRPSSGEPIPAVGSETQTAAAPPSASPPSTFQAASPPSSSQAVNPPPATPPAGSTAPAAARPAPADTGSGGFRTVGGTARVQLAAVPSAANAQSEWARFVQTYPDLLADLDLVTPTVDVGGTTLWRVQGGPLTGAGARQICQAIVSRGGECIVRD